MKLTYGSTSVTLREPEFDDAIERVFRNIVRRTRNGELIAFRPSGRTTRDTFTVTTTVNKVGKMTALRNLLTYGAGKYIEVTMLGGTFDAIVNMEEAEITTQRDLCSYTVTLTFYGWLT